MAVHLALVRGGNNHTRITENFLLGLADVLDASAWMNDEQLMAHVTLQEGSQWTARALRLACAEELGLLATPSEIVLFGARLKARVA